MSVFCRLRIMLVFCFLLAACDSGNHYAPVTEINTIESIPKTGQYHVRHEETLYEIAWRYGLDYRYLAARNRIKVPYRVHPGQIIYLRDAEAAVVTPVKIKTPIEEPVSMTAAIEDSADEPEEKPQPVPVSLPASKQVVQKKKEPDFSVSVWQWPARGKIIRSFSGLNKGIGIAGQKGDPVYATAPGKVVYAGDGLRGYGNLLIIKHNSTYLSAYAHNQRLLVKEGDWVSQGQKIAEMGNTGTDRVMLHFEIRRAGKPVNPASLLRS